VNDAAPSAAPPPGPSLSDRDPMTDFERREVTLLGRTKRVYVSGAGPAVIVMAEMPGIYAQAARLSWRRCASRS
jgi:hypothetical protein